MFEPSYSSPLYSGSSSYSITLLYSSCLSSFERSRKKWSQVSRRNVSMMSRIMSISIQ